MKNFWTNRIKIGRRVTYIGPDKQLNGKNGYVERIVDVYGTDWADVKFDHLHPTTLPIAVEKDYLEVEPKNQLIGAA